MRLLSKAAFSLLCLLHKSVQPRERSCWLETRRMERGKRERGAGKSNTGKNKGGGAGNLEMGGEDDVVARLREAEEGEENFLRHTRRLRRWLPGRTLPPIKKSKLNYVTEFWLRLRVLLLLLLLSLSPLLDRFLLPPRHDLLFFSPRVVKFENFWMFFGAVIGNRKALNDCSARFSKTQ